MGIGIQIKKPENVKADTETPKKPLLDSTPTDLHRAFYVVLGLTFPVALVSFFYFLQIRTF